MYLTTESNQVECDLVIADGSKPLLVSLIDVQIRNKKVCADFVKNKVVTLEFYDTDTPVRLYSRDCAFQFKGTKHGQYNHTIIRNREINNYCINWEGKNDLKVLTEFIQNSMYVPVTTEIVEQALRTNAISKISVYTYQSKLEPTAYRVHKNILLREMAKMKLDFKSSDFDWDTIQSTSDYLVKFVNPIKDRLEKNIKVLYDPKNIDPKIFEGKVQPYKGQIPIIQSCNEVLKRQKVIYLGGETGAGKSVMSLKALNCLGAKTTLLTVPQTTISHWESEIANVFGKHHIIVIKKTTEFIKLYDEYYDKGWKFDTPTFIIIGKETLKLDAKLKPAYVPKLNNSRVNGEIRQKTLCTCPDCGSILTNPLRNEYTELLPEDFNNKKKSNAFCEYCDAILWQSSFVKTKKTSVVNFIKRRNIKFDCIIVDEAHDAAKATSLIGTATKNLFKYGEKLILLSGTMNNGYASSLHNILMGICPQKLIDDDCLRKEDFVKKYGTLQAIDKGGDACYMNSGRAQIKDSKFKEIEGINPIVFTKYLADNYVFCALREVKDDLPPIIETYVPLQADSQLAAATNSLSERIRHANPLLHAMYEQSIVSHYANNTLGWGSIPINSRDGLISIDPVNSAFPQEKDTFIVNKVKQEKAEGRKVCIYVDSVGTSCMYHDGPTIPIRLKNKLEKEGLNVLHIKASTVSPIKRKAYLDKHLPKCDVLIIQKSLVKVGLNLQIIPTYIFVQPDYNPTDVFQARSRGMRINTVMENRIYYLYYENIKCENKIISKQQSKYVESRGLQEDFNFKIEKRVKRTSSALSSQIYDSLKG